MKIIFLDIDGVLNDHKLMSNGYCGIKKECVDNFNLILHEVPDAKIILSSAWRYMSFAHGIGEPEMSIIGISNMFLTHGLDCWGRFDGVTCSDEKIACEFLDWPRMTPATGEKWYNWVKNRGVEIRQMQIKYALNYRTVESYVVIDDMDLEIERQVLTSGDKGLTVNDAELAIEILNNYE